MSAGVRLRWVYAFAHRARVVELGPYADEREARDAFQRVYGYWPETPVSVVQWTPSADR